MNDSTYHEKMIHFLKIETKQKNKPNKNQIKTQKMWFFHTLSIFYRLVTPFTMLKKKIPDNLLTTPTEFCQPDSL